MNVETFTGRSHPSPMFCAPGTGERQVRLAWPHPLLTTPALERDSETCLTVFMAAHRVLCLAYVPKRERHVDVDCLYHR